MGLLSIRADHCNLYPEGLQHTTRRPKLQTTLKPDILQYTLRRPKVQTIAHPDVPHKVNGLFHLIFLACTQMYFNTLCGVTNYKLCRSLISFNTLYNVQKFRPERIPICLKRTKRYFISSFQPVSRCTSTHNRTLKTTDHVEAWYPSVDCTTSKMINYIETWYASQGHRMIPSHLFNPYPDVLQHVMRRSKSQTMLKPDTLQWTMQW